jgi:acyl-coenzyme A thioesterase 13
MDIMNNAKLIDASSEPLSTAVFSLTMTEYYANLNGVMHGGAAGVIFDMCTTSALGPVAKPGYWE